MKSIIATLICLFIFAQAFASGFNLNMPNLKIDLKSSDVHSYDSDQSLRYKRGKINTQSNAKCNHSYRHKCLPYDGFTLKDCSRWWEWEKYCQCWMICERCGHRRPL